MLRRLTAHIQLFDSQLTPCCGFHLSQKAPTMVIVALINPLEGWNHVSPWVLFSLFHFTLHCYEACYFFHPFLNPLPRVVLLILLAQRKTPLCLSYYFLHLFHHLVSAWTYFLPHFHCDLGLSFHFFFCYDLLVIGFSPSLFPLPHNRLIEFKL